MSNRVQKLRARRRTESDARFREMLDRLEKQWKEQLKIKSPAPHSRAGHDDPINTEPRIEQK